MSSTVFQIAAVITARASEDIPKFARCIEARIGGVLQMRIADETEHAHAIAQVAVDSGEFGPFKFISPSDSNYGIASDAINAGSPVYADEDGKLSNTGTVVEGYARQDTAGGIFEWRSQTVTESEVS